MTVIERQLPTIHGEASRRSKRAQNRFYVLVWAFISLTVLIALTAAVDWTVVGGFDAALIPSSPGVDLFAVIAFVAFVGTVVVRRTLSREKLQKNWYEGRAVAESVKSLAWRYAVGGAPFFCAPHEKAEQHDDVDELFTERTHEVLRQFDHPTKTSPGASLLTDWMRDARTRGLGERRHEYATGRIADQHTWYTTRAQENADRASLWDRVSLALEVTGGILALLKACGWFTGVDLFGVVATLLTGVLAWTNARQYETLAESYSVAADDLSGVHQAIELQVTEEAWAEFVANAEAAMSREHTVWRARRSAPTPA